MPLQISGLSLKSKTFIRTLLQLFCITLTMQQNFIKPTSNFLFEIIIKNKMCVDTESLIYIAILYYKLLFLQNFLRLCFSENFKNNE